MKMRENSTCYDLFTYYGLHVPACARICKDDVLMMGMTPTKSFVILSLESFPVGLF